MKRSAMGCLLLLVSACAAPSKRTDDLPSKSQVNQAAPEPGGSSPAEVISSFFAALARDDEAALVETLSPRQRARQQDPDKWRSWVAVWRRCQPDRIGQPVPGGRDESGQERAQVAMRYRCDGRVHEDATTVIRIGDRWFWDEN